MFQGAELKSVGSNDAVTDSIGAVEVLKVSIINQNRSYFSWKIDERTYVISEDTFIETLFDLGRVRTVKLHLIGPNLMLCECVHLVEPIPDRGFTSFNFYAKTVLMI